MKSGQRWPENEMRKCQVIFFLGPNQLDDRMEKTGLFYARYMDDWVVIAPTRWKLRSAIRIVNEILNVLRVEKHPGKTFIGCVERGFDFLGYFLKPGILSVSVVTINNCVERISRLYEQGASIERIGEYWNRFLRWLHAGISVEGRRLSLVASSHRVLVGARSRKMSCQNAAWIRKVQAARQCVRSWDRMKIRHPLCADRVEPVRLCGVALHDLCSVSRAVGSRCPCRGKSFQFYSHTGEPGQFVQ